MCETLTLNLGPKVITPRRPFKFNAIIDVMQSDSTTLSDSQFDFL